MNNLFNRFIVHRFIALEALLVQDFLDIFL